jgi:hypothetical protein
LRTHGLLLEAARSVIALRGSVDLLKQVRIVHARFVDMGGHRPCVEGPRRGVGEEAPDLLRILKGRVEPVGDVVRCDRERRPRMDAACRVGGLGVMIVQVSLRLPRRSSAQGGCWRCVGGAVGVVVFFELP